MNTIPSASEMFNTKVSEWRLRIDNYFEQYEFFRDSEKGALLFEITPELVTLLTGAKEFDPKNRKLYEVATSHFQEYMSKYATDDCEYNVKCNYMIRPGTSKTMPYFVATATQKD